MGFDLIEILKAWVTAENPNKIQKELAELRLSVCMGCDMRKEIIHNKKWSANWQAIFFEGHFFYYIANKKALKKLFKAFS